MLSKKEAAEYLGISSRTLERHVKDGKIGVRYQPGATNDVAMLGLNEHLYRNLR